MHEDRAEKDTKRDRVLTAAVLLLLAAGLTGADASQPGLPDKWPACYFRPTSDSVIPRLRRMYERRRIAAGVDSSKVAKTELRWRDVASPYLAALLPDTRWYLMEAWNDNTPIGCPPCFAVAVRNDTSYLHWDINHLLAADGLLSDTSRRADVARIAVCFGLLDETSYRLECRPTMPVRTVSDFITGERRVTTATVRYAVDALRDTPNRGSEPSYEETLRRLHDSTAIPALEFITCDIEPGFLLAVDSGSSRVICDVAERPRTFHLTSNRGLLTRMYELDGPSIAYDTLPAKPSQPPASNSDIER